jgi:ABC-2 type transport system ATP-binding protein
MDAIVVKALGKTYGGHGLPMRRSEEVRALHDLSISVHEGEIFGFLGPNGSGKSTTIRLLLGYLHPTAGGASVLGRDISTDGLEIRRRTGYLPGGIALYDTMTGIDQLHYVAALYGQDAPLRGQLIEQMELSQRDLKRQIRDYSRGMRQKIGIVQAFQHDPELAILDEPTEGLDPLMQRSFYEILEGRQRAGRTIFFSSHILSEVERVCHRVAIVRKGELVAVNDITALLQRRRRHVEMRLDGPAPELTHVEGISDVRIHDDVLTCEIEGDPGPFLAALQGVGVRDLLIEPARLEEAFMEYYSDDSDGVAEDEAAARDGES